MSGKLLLRTPDLLRDEGILGYVLRVAEANGYDTPWHVFRHAGIAQGEMLSAGLPVDGLASILGTEVKQLAGRAYTGVTDDGQSEYRLNGRSIGRGLNLAPLRLTRPAICPACIESNGCADVCWDASAFVACPIHGIRLLQACPSCHARLSWFRPGLLRCSCGASLLEAVPEVPPGVTLDLMALLRTKLVEQGGVAAEDRSSGLPTAQLSCMPLESLLRLLALLQSLDCSTDRGGGDVAEVFSEWPLGFHRFLRRIASNQAPDGVQSVGLRKQFSKFYQSIFKSKVPLIGVEFIRTEFVEFGQNEWGAALVDKKLLGRASTEQRYVSSTALAARLGVMPVTVRRWIDKGAIPAQAVEFGQSRRFVADASVVDQTPREDDEQLDAREAGKFVTLPVSALNQLKRTGHYSTNPIANRRKGFWPADLTALNKRLAATGDGLGVASGDGTVSLGHVLNCWKLGVPEAKGALLAELLSEAIVPVGRSGYAVSDLQLRRSDVEAFRVRYALDSDREVISSTVAARMLGTGVHVVAGLVSAGYLKRGEGRSTGVRRESVEAFLRSWLPLSSLAKELRTSSASLLSRARKHAMPVMRLPTHPGLETPFINAASAEHLRALA